MNRKKDDLVNYRIGRAYETLDAAFTLADAGLWNGVVNRLYYAAFQALTAVMLQDDIRVKSYAMIKTMLGDQDVLTSRPMNDGETLQSTVQTSPK